MIYLSGADRPETRAAAARGYALGLMAQPKSGVHRYAHLYPAWACDNGCFARGERFDLDAYLRWLGGLDHRATCLFAVAPDVFGDGAATLARSRPALGRIRALGYRAALVAQPGVGPADLPWPEFDCLFIGGPDWWQGCPACWALVEAARRRGKWLHKGRVNSGRRLRAAAVAGFDSADGTYIKFGPDRNLPNVLRWLDSLRYQARLPLAGERAEELPCKNVSGS